MIHDRSYYIERRKTQGVRIDAHNFSGLKGIGRKSCILLALLHVVSLISVQALNHSRIGSPSRYQEEFSDGTRSDESDSVDSVGEEELIISAIARVHKTDIATDTSTRYARPLSRPAPQHQISHGRPRSTQRRQQQIEEVHSHSDYGLDTKAPKVKKSAMCSKKISTTPSEKQLMRSTNPPSLQNRTKPGSKPDNNSNSIRQVVPSQHEAGSSLKATSSGRSKPAATSSPLPATRLQRQINPSEVANKGPKPSSTTTPWIRNFLSERPKDVLLPVPKDYISDGFNLAQLAPIIERIGFQILGENAVSIAKQLMQLSQHSFPIYRLALQLILNETEDEFSVLQHPLIPPQVIQEAAQALYLMVHARFCQSPRGLDALRRIVRTEMFGKCPRGSCRGTPLLPYGPSSDYSGLPQESLCSRYCPNCGEDWSWWDSKTDGCAFGPDLCHLFLLTHGAEIYSSTKMTTKTESSGHPNHIIMGFQIHPATLWGRPLDRYAT